MFALRYVTLPVILLSILASAFAEEAKQKKSKESKVAPKKKSDFELIQGTWEAVSVHQNGTINKLILSYQITFSGKKWEAKSKRRVNVSDPRKGINLRVPESIRESSNEGTFSLDSTKNPNRIDMKVKTRNDAQTTWTGIYKFEGETLTICFRHWKSPKEFSTKKRDGSILYVLKRKKAEKAADKKEKKVTTESLLEASSAFSFRKHEKTNPGKNYTIEWKTGADRAVVQITLRNFADSNLPSSKKHVRVENYSKLKAAIKALPKGSTVSYIYADARADLLDTKQLLELYRLSESTNKTFYLHKGG